MAVQRLKSNVMLIPLSELIFIGLLLKLRYIDCPDSFNKTNDKETKVCGLIPPVRDRLQYVNSTRFLKYLQKA